MTYSLVDKVVIQIEMSTGEGEKKNWERVETPPNEKKQIAKQFSIPP